MAAKHFELSDPNSCLNKAADDEPIFVLRASDLLAAGLVYGWASLAEDLGADPQKCIRARLTARDMQNWVPRKLPT